MRLILESVLAYIVAVSLSALFVAGVVYIVGVLK